MQGSRRLPETVHIMLMVYLLQDEYKLTSEVIARSLAIDPTIVRRLMSRLKKAGLLMIPPKKGGATSVRPLEAVTLWDLYSAVEEEKPLFAFHSCENGRCPIAKNMHAVLDTHLEDAQNAMKRELERVTLELLYRDLTVKRGITREMFRKRAEPKSDNQ
jgi:DNA-binding IscR family transcriptional regulator